MRSALHRQRQLGADTILQALKGMPMHKWIHQSHDTQPYLLLPTGDMGSSTIRHTCVSGLKARVSTEVVRFMSVFTGDLAAGSRGPLDPT